LNRAQSEIRIGLGKPLKTKQSEVTIKKNNFMRPPSGRPGRPISGKTGLTIATKHTYSAKEYFRDPSVNEGFYSKKREGVADVDPKVMEPFVPIPGRPPRRVVIDRQRKLFASLNIEELLLELGIDYRSGIKNPAEWLPLEPFDDTEYDCRMPEEWISFGETEDGEFYPIPGKVLKVLPNGTGTWEDILVDKYDAESKSYIGNWDTDCFEPARLTRINLLFNAEDPRIFA